MKTTIKHIKWLFLTGLLPLLSFGLQSCINDTYPDIFTPEEPEGEAGVKRFFSMQIVNDQNENIEPYSHEFSFDNGAEYEHKIDLSQASDNVIIFFNDNWTLYGYTTLEYDHAYSQGTVEGYPSEASYIVVIESPDPDNLTNLPTNGLMVLNAHKIINDLERLTRTPGATIDDVLKLTDVADDSRRPGKNGLYHTMTSAAYLMPDNQSDGWKHSAIFKIDKSKIYDTRQQAVASPAAIAIVERMDSKFSITFPGAAQGSVLDFIPDNGRSQVVVCDYNSGHATYSNRTWTCSIEGWGINKYETSSYYFRNILGNGATSTSYPYTYGADINTTGQPFYNGWNNWAQHRSHWGIDPNYDDGIFPIQIRPAIDNPGLHFYGSVGKPSLGYISYNELSTDFSGLGTENGVYLYSSENTFPDIRLSGHWQHDIAGSELLVGARLHINRINESAKDYDLFRNRIGVFYPSVTDYATYFIQTFNTQLSSQSTMSFRYYDWDNPAANTTQEVMQTIQLKYNNYKLYYEDQPLTPETMAAMPHHSISAYIENGDGKVIPWIEGMYIGRREIDPNTYEEVGEIQKLSISSNNFKSLIYDWIGAFDHFNKGRMVYSVPILHKTSAQNVSSPSYKPTVGDYGVARNTWYSFAIEGVSSLGAPVDDLDQKIIVYKTSLENSIMVEMKVLDWHIFSTNVTLPGQLK